MVDLEYAYNQGIRLTTADSLEELIKIKERSNKWPSFVFKKLYLSSNISVATCM